LKIKLLSDLHFEHYQDYGDKFIRNLATNADVCILAGDIATQRTKSNSPSQIINILSRFKEKFQHVIFVPGNHDYIGFNITQYDAILAEYAADTEGVHFLNRDVIEIDNQRFLGTTLWYGRVKDSVSVGWIDFDLIPGFSFHYIEENEKNVQFLKRELREDDIVITHHLPSYKSVHAKYINNPFNCFFVCYQENLIIDRKPKLWLHGHTHECFDYKIEKTRVVCNPRGYPNYPTPNKMENINFNQDLVLTI